MPIGPAQHRPTLHKAITHQSATQHDPKQKRSSTAQGYGYRWQQARAGYLAKHPLCAECQKQGRVEIATDLDHIEPHKGCMIKFWRRDNWQGLCRSCHSRKTAKYDSGFGNNRMVKYPKS